MVITETFVAGPLCGNKFAYMQLTAYGAPRDSTLSQNMGPGENIYNMQCSTLPYLARKINIEFHSLRTHPHSLDKRFPDIDKRDSQPTTPVTVDEV